MTCALETLENNVYSPQALAWGLDSHGRRTVRVQQESSRVVRRPTGYLRKEDNRTLKACAERSCTLRGVLNIVRLLIRWSADHRHTILNASGVMPRTSPPA